MSPLREWRSWGSDWLETRAEELALSHCHRKSSKLGIEQLLAEGASHALLPKGPVGEAGLWADTVRVAGRKGSWARTLGSHKRALGSLPLCSSWRGSKLRLWTSCTAMMNTWTRKLEEPKSQLPITVEAAVQDQDTGGSGLARTATAQQAGVAKLCAAVSQRAQVPCSVFFSHGPVGSPEIPLTLPPWALGRHRHLVCDALGPQQALAEDPQEDPRC